ncbi:hypothetical protein ACFQZE_06295 [Paenibacillus sp. GCM10027627]|uniref:hypothetical protein n=1 Tax=unclassified Paenibacillus TaxID=185978 RepID=UPI00362623D6
MYNYKVERYDLADYEEYIIESNDMKYVESEVLRLSSLDEGQFAYRMETWKDDKLLNGMRFFQNGIELTDRLKKSIEIGS